ncbi:MAG: L-carnitine dehydratase/bile acid-inducible protein [Sphingomonas bacterium]|uniref:CaiB/BaiF CoA-transferase family protein n=1 Tax=Sphingomonas bacterium TaxID=1895847 RepID=UPI002603E8B1|nr:CoA transferase [Sphingomonas bacterium]MDB5694607.1 L-carnitine dehydratase/bile acid-inducible protein [Sphingomonas bacterium]
MAAAQPTAPLAHLRVVETGALEAVAYCGKMLADFGADVVRIEPAEGDPLRRIPPLVDIGAGLVESALGAWLNTNKRSLIAPADSDAAAAQVEALTAHADVLLDAGEPATAAARHARLRAANPRLAIVSLSWFGESGPYRDLAGSDAVVRAMAGLVKLVGPAEGPPIMVNDHQASIHAGLTAYNAAMAALHAGGSRRFEVSVLEACTVLAEFQIALRYGPPADEGRLGTNKFYPTYPLGIFPCREGWLGVTVGHLDQWAAFCDMLDLNHVRADPRFQTRFDRSRHMAELDGIIGDRLKSRTAQEWFQLALARRVPLVVVPSMAELLAQPVHRARGAFQSVSVGEARFEGPSVPLHLCATPPARNGVAPLPGEGTPPPARAAPALPLVPADRRPLAGMRILDLSMGWAGPLATRQLADLGAEIVKVEACAYPDWWRPTEGEQERIFEHSPWFIALNRNKTDAAIDIYTPEGLALVKRLAGDVDAVIENFAANVMPKLGLTYDALRVSNPSIVMMSMPAYAGDWSDLRAYGSTLEHGSGLPSVTGPADGPPVLNHLAYGDPMGGLSGCAALLTALLHKRLTGEGQQIVLSQVQAMLPLAAPWVIEQSLTGKVERLGNRHPTMVPHNVFPTADADGWIVVAVPDDPTWQALAGIIDLQRPDLATLQGRREQEDGIEAALSRWTRSRSGVEAMAALQGAGVPAGIAATPGDLYTDPHLVARGDWEVVERRWSGPQPLFASPFREEGRPYPVLSPAPTLGEHNARVLGDMLGLDAAAIADLEARGIVGDCGRPRVVKAATPPPALAVA